MSDSENAKDLLAALRASMVLPAQKPQVVSDPAIEAAQRACEAQGDDLVDNDVAVDTAIAAAREALAPLRELHKPVEITVRRQNFEPEIQRVCDHCDGGFQDWPCPTAIHSYSSEELS